MRAARGFTLTELLIVVALLGVVAALGARALSRPDRRREAAGLAQEIYVRATGARLAALSSGCQAELELVPQDPGGQVARVRLAQQPGMAPSPLTFAPPSDTVTRRRDAAITGAASGVDLAGAPPGGPAASDAVVFYPDGSARLRSSGQPGATIYVRDAAGENPYRVVIFGQTGFAKLLSR